MVEYDLIVIGSGPGGYEAAIRAAQLGMHTAVVERDRLGGVCLNWGCIPSKALLRSAELANTIRHAGEFGLNVQRMDFDFPAIIKRSREAADRLSKGVAYLFRKNKVEHLQGTGRFLGETTLEVVRDEKAAGTYKAKRFLVATGGRPKAFPGVPFDQKRVLTSKEAMVLESPPKRMLIIGAGAVGVEFAYFYSTFGTRVALVEMMPTILPLEDIEVTKLLSASLSKAGIEIFVESKVECLEVRADGVSAAVTNRDGSRSVDADVVLVAVGVQGNIEGTGLETIGVETDKGFVKVDDHYRTSVPNVCAIGDVIGAPMLAHAASAEGIAAVEWMAGKERPVIDYDTVPSCTYCIPQVARVGITEQDALKQGLAVKVGRFPLRANGKALVLGEAEGMVKLIFGAKYGELLGAHIIGPEATELIAELGLAESLEATADAIHHTIHAHPTISEAVMEAAAQAYGEAINI